MTLSVVYAQRVHCALCSVLYCIQNSNCTRGGRPGYSRILDQLGVSDLIGDGWLSTNVSIQQLELPVASNWAVSNPYKSIQYCSPIVASFRVKFMSFLPSPPRRAGQDQRGVSGGPCCADCWNWGKWWLLEYIDFFPVLAALVSPVQNMIFLTAHFSLY